MICVLVGNISNSFASCVSTFSFNAFSCCLRLWSLRAPAVSIGMTKQNQEEREEIEVLRRRRRGGRDHQDKRSHTQTQTSSQHDAQSEYLSPQRCTPPPRRHPSRPASFYSRGKASRRAGRPVPWSQRGPRRWETENRSEQKGLSTSIFEILLSVSLSCFFVSKSNRAERQKGEPERVSGGGGGELRFTMKAVERISPKLSSWAAACRGFWRLESMTIGSFSIKYQ